MSEENTEEFVVCTECRPFSLVHTCIVTPDRTPMCSSRNYAAIKAAALFGSPAVPFKRRTEEHVELRKVFARGAMLDRERGEYEGANRMYREMTHGKLDRVFLHSVRGFPHTSCGCFQALAFWIDEVKGIGVMGRGSKAVAPNGMTWDLLANAAGGKQTDGVMGISVAYVRSRHFLKGDGGHANLVWVDSELLAKVKDVLPKGKTVATEKEVSTVDELRHFVKR
jgi:acetyl-CoA decarbonylase/synthase complex subunit beta